MMVRTIIAVALVSSLVALVGCGGESREDEERRTRQEALSGMTLVSFEATAPDGGAFTRDDLSGKWTLLSFGFTHCELACPPMHANTIQLMGKLENTPLRFVTLSVDPVHDTPERLRAYTEQLGVDADRWTFLAADAETRDDVLAGLGFSVTDDTSEANRIDLPGGGTMNNIGHPTRLILIGPDANVVDLYPGIDSTQLDAIARSIRQHMMDG